MNTHTEIRKLADWTLFIVKNGHIIDTGAVGDSDELAPGTSFSLEGTVPAGGELFVYVLQLGAHRQYEILFRPPHSVPSGTTVRVPPTGTLTTPLQGELFVAGSARQIEDSEWPNLLPGRDGDVGHGGTTTSVKSNSGNSTAAVKSTSGQPTK